MTSTFALRGATLRHEIGGRHPPGKFGDGYIT